VSELDVPLHHPGAVTKWDPPCPLSPLSGNQLFIPTMSPQSPVIPTMSPQSSDQLIIPTMSPQSPGRRPTNYTYHGSTVPGARALSGNRRPTSRSYPTHPLPLPGFRAVKLILPHHCKGGNTSGLYSKNWTW